MLSQRILWTDSFVNLGEEVRVILDFAMTIWRFWIRDRKYVLLLVKYLLLTIQMQSFAHHVCARLCVRERKRERDRVTSQWSQLLNCGLCANTYEHHHWSVTRLFPSLAWTDGKTKDIINHLYIYFESWSLWLWKGTLYFWLVLVVFGQSMHWASWPIRADCACWKEGLCRKRVWERRGIEDLQCTVFEK